MIKNESHSFLPDYFSSLLIAFLFLSTLPLKASESADYSRFEKIYKTTEMETLDHKKIKLSDLGSETVIVNFWASWCIPCLAEMPSLINLSNKFTKVKLRVVAINTDEDDQLKNIAKIKKKLNIPESFVIVPDIKFKIADDFKFSSIPVTVIFKKGKVVYFSNGPVDFSKVPLDFFVTTKH